LAPWATTVLATKSGIEGDGVITLVLAIIGGIALWSYYSNQGGGAAVTAAISGLISPFFALYDVAHISSSNTRIFGQDVHVVSVGWGLWLTLAAAVVLTGTCVVLRRDSSPSARTRPGRNNRDLERVRKLAELHQAGALTDAEFEAQKRK